MSVNIITQAISISHGMPTRSKLIFIKNRKKGQGTKDKEGDQLSRDETVRRKVRTLTKARLLPVETETAPNPNTKC